MNQAASFALLGVGGMAVVKALTGASWADVIKGHPGAVPDAGATPATAGVAGVGATAAKAATAATAPGTATTAKGLTSGQETFADELAAKTGLSGNVIAAWLLAEESGSAAASRQAAGNNDWLNIGYTDTATYGASGSEWSSPAGAADATATWLAGGNSIPGYGTASSGIRSILATAGQNADAQIRAIQNSGWASSGYPDLPALYQQVTG
jgi:hypothetical protein